MSQVEKFLFETSFDAESAVPPLAAAETPPEAATPPPSFTEADLQEAERLAISKGRKEGLEEARQGTEQAVAQALSAIGAQLESCAPQITEINERHERQSLEAAAAMLRRLFPELERRNAMAEILAVIESCLQRLRDEPRIVIRTADARHDELRAHIDPLAEICGFEGRIVLLADDTLAPSDVKVEWADGGAERDTRRLWDEIDKVLATALGEHPAAPNPAGDEPSPAPGEAMPAEAGESAVESAA